MENTNLIDTILNYLPVSEFSQYESDPEMTVAAFTSKFLNHINYPYQRTYRDIFDTMNQNGLYVDEQSKKIYNQYIPTEIKRIDELLEFINETFKRYYIYIEWYKKTKIRIPFALWNNLTYISESGWCVQRVIPSGVLELFNESETKLKDMTVALPVKFVQDIDWVIYKGFVFVLAEYNQTFGVVIPNEEQYQEWDKNAYPEMYGFNKYSPW